MRTFYIVLNSEGKVQHTFSKIEDAEHYANSLSTNFNTKYEVVKVCDIVPKLSENKSIETPKVLSDYAEKYYKRFNKGV